MDELYQRLGININFNIVLIYASLIWVRCLAVTSTIPFLFGKPVPKQVRVGGALVLMVFLYSVLMPANPPKIPESHLVIVLLYLKEAFIGLVIGMAASMLFYAFEAAGQIIDGQRGMSIARVLIPSLGEQGSVSGSLLFQMAIVIYLTIGGHRLFFEGLCDSFTLLPVLEVPVVREGLYPMMELFMVATAKVIYIAMQISAPVIIAIFLSDMIMGIANRIAPQINVWEMSFTLRGYVGTLMLFFSIGLIINSIENHTLLSNKYARQVVNIIRYGEMEIPVAPGLEEEKIDEIIPTLPALEFPPK